MILSHIFLTQYTEIITLTTATIININIVLFSYIILITKKTNKSNLLLLVLLVYITL